MFDRVFDILVCVAAISQQKAGSGRPRTEGGRGGAAVKQEGQRWAKSIFSHVVQESLVTNYHGSIFYILPPPRLGGNKNDCACGKQGVKIKRKKKKGNKK